MPDLSNIVYRGSLHRPLTHSELDNNFNLLNTYLVSKTSDTGYAILPSGTTSERPVNTTDGYLRYNTEINKLEGYINSNWQPFGEVGYQGSINTGQKGYTGSSGLFGFTGSIGNTGQTSTVTGLIGATGPNDLRGYTGSIGLPGTNGYDGSRGAIGPTSTVKGPLGYHGSIKPGSASPTVYSDLSSVQYQYININNKLEISSEGTIDISNILGTDPAICVNRNDSTFFGGSKYLSFQYNTYEVCKVIIGDTGNGFIPGTNSRLRFYDTSDYRIKENLIKIDNILNKISELTVYICNYKTDKKRFRCLLAHELQDIFPYAVTGKKNEINNLGEPIYQSIDYSKLIPVIIAGINELTKKIEQLKHDYYIYKSTK